MAEDVVDSYQLASLIELTNSMAESSIHSTSNTEQLISQYVDNFMWIINFDLCLIIEKSNSTQIKLVAGDESTAGELELLTTLQPNEFLQNMKVSLPNNDYFLFYNVLHKTGNNVDLIVFLQKANKFSSQSSIILELFCSSVKRLIETKANAYKNTKLKNEKLILEESNKLKSMFLSTISHEIRTPMNGILGMVQLFKDTALDKQQQEMLETITESSQQFSKILDDILDFGQLETSNNSLTEIDFNLENSIQTLVQQFIEEITYKGIKLSTTFDQNMPPQLIGDIRKIGKILTCLLSNAVKFTSSGEISIVVTAQKSVANIYLIDISIKDTGVGIAKEQQSMLFQPFTQADSSMSRKHGGMGLGLAISNKLSTALNGKIKVQSDEGSGSTFTLSIPLSSSQNTNLETSGQPVVSQSNHIVNTEHRVLVVEDVRINQKIAQKMLAKLGLDCDIAENGLAALEAIKKSEYSIVFMDLQMPEMDGLTATKEIIELLGSNRPIIVAMTANVSIQDRDNCNAVGMDDFIAKPIDIRELARTLSTEYQN